MKPSFLLLLSLALLLVLAGSASAGSGAVLGHVIVLDPGHGGSDPGSTQCPGLYESDAVLDIAHRLEALLISNGATVYLTRTDGNPSNSQRAAYANSVKGEVLLSIHLNGSTNHSVNGTIGLWGKRNKDLTFTKAMHAGLPTALGVPNQGVTNFASGVLLKSTMPATIQESVYISNANECTALTDDTGARQAQIAQALYDGLASWFASH